MQLPPGLLMQRRHFVAHLLHGIKDMQGPVVDTFAVIRDSHATGGAVQQAHANALLQQLDAFADIRRGHPQLAGRGGKTGAPGHDHEHAQVVEIRQIVHESCLIHHQFA